MSLHPPAGFRGAFRADEIARAVYSEAAGIGRVWPEAVAVPLDADDVAVLVSWARDTGRSVIPRGSGSSMAGGAIGSGVVLDLSRLRRLDDPDVDERSIRGDVGILRGELNRRAESAGLRFPVDPSSGEFCTIGGMAATNAAGPHSLLHGPTRPWVLALECVFDDGSRATVRRGDPPPDVPAVQRFMRTAHPEIARVDGEMERADVLKDSSGYATRAYAHTRELVDLLVGSEGTLATFTAVEVALMPMAASRASLFVSFRSIERAVEAAIAAREGGAAACELLDRTFLRIAATGGHPLPVSSETDAVLLVEVESHDAPSAAAGAEQLRATFRAFDAIEVIVASEPGPEAELWSFRHSASPAIARMDPSLRSMQFIEDAAVPPRALAAYVRGVRGILDRAQTTGVIFGHAGDAHVHVNPLVDVRNPGWRSRIEQILIDVTDLVAKLGGTLTGEHGDGRLRTPLLDRVWSPSALTTFALVKRAFDPDGVFNPGVKVALDGQKAMDLVKYDPGLESLPAAANSALELVDRERGYSRFRLDLL